MLDCLFAVISIIILSPFFLAIIIILGSRSKSVYFKQTRPGKNMKVFILYKFKTMTDDIDKSGNILPDEKRITRFGNLLRKSSLDELPQLYNILKGDMSFVGPRPLLLEYLPLYNAEQLTRHEVLPGLTGWAQVNGRNSLSWTQKFEYDIWYIDNISFFLDVKITFLTILNVLRRKGIAKAGHATTEKFNGYN